MITVALNKANFEYDIHSLVKAFYSEHEVLVRVVCNEENQGEFAAVKELSEAELSGQATLQSELSDLSGGRVSQPKIFVKKGAQLDGKADLSERKRWKAEEFRKQALEAEYHLSVEYRKDAIAFFFFKPRSSDELQTDLTQIIDSVTFWNTMFPADAAVLSGQISVNPSDRRETKNRLKQKLYALLKELSGRTLPWGTLTGIRPTKIPMAMLEEGQPEAHIREYMRETYFATDAKIDLSIEVAKREMELLSRIDYEDGYSLYVGIPFCPTTCLYCSFTSYPISAWKKRADEYLDALCKEIVYTAERMKNKYLNSVYIGGGTPTSLEPEQLERLITVIGESFDLFDEKKHIVYGGLQREAAHREIFGSLQREELYGGISGDLCSENIREKKNGVHSDKRNVSGSLRENHLLEFTVEAGRPDSITEDKLKVLRRHNISRISINPQTMKEDTLRMIGRRHTVAQIKESFALARDMGFDNINMDLIVGLPEESLEDVRRTMEEIAKLSPDNVTVHSLAVKRAARLRMEQENYSHLHMENTWETIDLTARYCREMGLSPYYLYRQKNMAGNFENVGYAAPEKAGVYNILIMEEKQTIMALGAGATTKVVYDHRNRIERVGNVKDLNNYLERVDEMIERKEELLTGIL